MNATITTGRYQRVMPRMVLKKSCVPATHNCIDRSVRNDAHPAIAAFIYRSLIRAFFINVFPPNVSVHRRRTLCAVRCDALFNAFIFPDFHACRPKISINRPENRVFGLVEPIFSIFRPIFAVIFIFRGIARIFSSIFFSVAVVAAISP